MKKIPLTQGEFAIVDAKDFVWLNEKKWGLAKNGKMFYAVRTETINGKSKSIYMHRLILNISHREIKIDHKDGNGLNNQRNNIRIATTGQNTANSSSYANSTSKYKGVCWDKRTKKWKVTICKNGKYIHLGRYDDENMAGLAYNKKAIEIHGEFARLNTIQKQ